MPDAAIGVFDSGVGGLTVVRAIAKRLPNESIVYLGDTARLPYGTKSATTVTRYAAACTNKLLESDVKLVVIACNTASAFALPSLRESLPVPVIGVIEPGAQAAVRQSRSKTIGVIGTNGTIASDSYQHCIRRASPHAKVFARACPLFVPLAEEGWTEGEVPARVATHYLAELIAQGIDTLVLGCTHYPLLREPIAAAAGENVCLVDSAEATAEVVEQVLTAGGIRAQNGNKPEFRFMVTDIPNGIAQLSTRFLGKELHDVEWVDI